LVFAESGGKRADVYSPDGVYLYPLNVVGAAYLTDVTSTGDILFFADWSLKAIHVMREDIVYLHRIGIGWRPMGICVYGYNLFVPDRYNDVLYKIPLDVNYDRNGSDHVINSTNLSMPYCVHANADRIAVGNLGDDTMVVFSNDGSYAVEWVYGGSGTADGKMNDPHGIVMDTKNRYLVADWNNNRVPLVSQNGTFITNLVTGIPGPRGILVVGNTVYVTLSSSPKVIKLVVN
jgi:hypothetical protein